MAISKRLSWQLGTHFSGHCHCRGVVAVERFKQESMYGPFVDQQKVAVVKRLYWQWGTHFSGCCHCSEVVIVERFKQESMYGPFVELSRKSGHCCGEVVI